MITKTTKLDDFTLQIDTSITEDNSNQYDYDNLIDQRATIVAQQKKDNDLRVAELAEIDSYLQEMVKVGIKSRKEQTKDGISEAIDIRHI